MDNHQDFLDKDLESFIDDFVKDYKGSFDDLYRSLGILVLGKTLGWKVLRITLGNNTYLKYQKILGLDFKQEFREKGIYAHKSVALELVEKLENFWNVVKGIEKIDHKRKKMLV
jgi:hypothetical protein